MLEKYVSCSKELTQKVHKKLSWKALRSSSQHFCSQISHNQMTPQQTCQSKVERQIAAPCLTSQFREVTGVWYVHCNPVGMIRYNRIFTKLLCTASRNIRARSVGFPWIGILWDMSYSVRAILYSVQQTQKLTFARINTGVYTIR